MPHPLVIKLRDVVTPLVEGAGYELVDVEWKREPAGWVLRVLIDGPGGITHHDCERVSRELSPLLDVHDLVSQAFSLEVSSPGLDRPLRTAAHFAQFVGRRARVRLQGGLDGRRNFAGAIVAVDPERREVRLSVEGRDFVLPLDDLERANLEIELAPALAPGAGTKPTRAKTRPKTVGTSGAKEKDR